MSRAAATDEGFERMRTLLVDVAYARRAFAGPFEAGYDAGLHGVSPANAHFCWFALRADRLAWERGCREGAAAIAAQKAVR